MPFRLGSPPPMRGKAECPAVPVHSCGITPAYAGKRWKEKAREKVTRDHPRLCGEKGIRETIIKGNTGSPPPMRGKGSVLGLRRVREGITPAYAGKRSGESRVKPLQEDHPRLCGEKRALRGSTPQQLGSPPPMRGKGGIYHEKDRRRRITPAYAGKRQSFVLCFRSHQDHPRLCGEKSLPAQLRRFFRGSPPPMRGKVL